MFSNCLETHCYFFSYGIRVLYKMDFSGQCAGCGVEVWGAEGETLETADKEAERSMGAVRPHPGSRMGRRPN